MREIKFRAKAINNDYYKKGTWVYGSLLVFKGFSIFDSLFKNWVDVDGKTKGQYIGLKDKNGVEIYEGDIIRANPYGADVIGKVCYTGFAYEVLEKTNDPYEFSGYKPMTCIESNVLYEAMEGHSLFGNRLEVIGNIYENPELLQNKEKRRKKA